MSAALVLLTPARMGATTRPVADAVVRPRQACIAAGAGVV
jgi:hypothetical protein